MSGFVGARLLLQVERESVAPLLGICMLLLVPLLFVKRDLGIQPFKPNRIQTLTGHLLYLLGCIYGAALQVGSGPLLLYVVMWFLGLTIIQASATSSFCWMFISITSLLTFLASGMVDLSMGVSLLLGSLLGGYVGAHTAVTKGDKWTKGFFAVVIVLAALKFLIVGG